MVAGTLRHLAEYERTLINERAAAGREASRVRGRPVGRKPEVSPAQLAQAKILKAQGQTMAEICAGLHVKRSTLSRALSHARAYRA